MNILESVEYNTYEKAVSMETKVLEIMLHDYMAKHKDFLQKLQSKYLNLGYSSELSDKRALAFGYFVAAQTASNKKEFISKMKGVVKKLRETHICLRLMHINNPQLGDDDIRVLVKETHRMIVVFTSQISVTKKSLIATIN